MLLFRQQHVRPLWSMFAIAEGATAARRNSSTEIVTSRQVDKNIITLAGCKTLET